MVPIARPPQEAICPEAFASRYDTCHAHPKACVTDELHGTNGFLNGGILLLGAIDFVLVDQHACVSFLEQVSSSWVRAHRCAQLSHRTDPME